MRKLIFVMTIVAIILAVLVGLTIIKNSLGDWSRSLAQTMIVGKTFNGMTIESLDIRKAAVQIPTTLSWKGVQVNLRLDKKSFLSNRNFIVSIPRLDFTADNFLQNEYTVSASQINISPQLKKREAQYDTTSKFLEGFENGLLNLRLRLNFMQVNTLKDQIRSQLYNLAPLFSEGKTLVPVQLSGITHFTINQNPVSARIFTRQRSDGYYALQINPEFFQTMAWYNTFDMNDYEAKLLSEYPFRIKRLVKIMVEAKRESERFKNSKNVPEDAYRHVLWSYLLTQAYGPDFAKQVTDAHEIGDPTNTEAEHQMDYHNNTIGRHYARNNVKKHDILDRVLNDRNVIRKPREQIKN